MPQPYKGHWTSNQKSLSQRPQLAAHVGIITSLWAQVDVNLGNLLAIVLQADAHVATAMYIAISNDGARSAAMRAAAKECLGPDLLTEFEDVLGRVSEAAEQRNKVVHAIWAVPENKPDSIIRLDNRAFTGWFASLTALNAKPRAVITDKDHKRMLKAMESHLGSAMEYKEHDFIQIEQRIETVLAAIGTLSVKLSLLSFPPHMKPASLPSLPRSEDKAAPSATPPPAE